MSDTMDYEDAADAVQKKPSDETASVFYEKRKYPLLPEGVYPAMCIKAEVKDANPHGQYYKPGDKNIHLTWEIRDLPMKDEDGKVMKGDNDQPMNFRVFSRPMAIGFGNRTNLRKLFLKLTGFDLAQKDNPLVVKTMKKITMESGRVREGFSLDFDQKVFEYMEANLDIEHQSWEDKNTGEERTSAYIVNYKLSPEQKKKNYDQLPPQAKTQAMSTEEVEDEKETEVEYSKDAESTMGKLEQAQKEKVANDPGLESFMEKTDDYQEEIGDDFLPKNKNAADNQVDQGSTKSKTPSKKSA